MRISPRFALLAWIIVFAYSSLKPFTILRLELTVSNDAIDEIISNRREHCRNAPYPCATVGYTANSRNHGSRTVALTEPTPWGEYTFVKTYHSQTDEIVLKKTKFFPNWTKILISAGFFLSALILIIRSILRQRE